MFPICRVAMRRDKVHRMRLPDDGPRERSRACPTGWAAQASSAGAVHARFDGPPIVCIRPPRPNCEACGQRQGNHPASTWRRGLPSSGADPELTRNGHRVVRPDTVSASFVRSAGGYAAAGSGVRFQQTVGLSSADVDRAASGPILRRCKRPCACSGLWTYGGPRPGETGSGDYFPRPPTLRSGGLPRGRCAPK